MTMKTSCSVLGKFFRLSNSPINKRWHIFNIVASICKQSLPCLEYFLDGGSKLMLLDSHVLISIHHINELLSICCRKSLIQIHISEQLIGCWNHLLLIESPWSVQVILCKQIVDLSINLKINRRSTEGMELPS